MHTFKGFLSEGDTSDATNAEMAICYQYNLMYNEGMTHEGALEKAGISSEKFKKVKPELLTIGHNVATDSKGSWGPILNHSGSGSAQNYYENARDTTPKADFTGDAQHNISLKKAGQKDKGAQLISAKSAEAAGVVNAAIKHYQKNSSGGVVSGVTEAMHILQKEMLATARNDMQVVVGGGKTDFADWYMTKSSRVKLVSKYERNKKKIADHLKAELQILGATTQPRNLDPVRARLIKLPNNIQLNTLKDLEKYETEYQKDSGWKIKGKKSVRVNPDHIKKGQELSDPELKKQITDVIEVSVKSKAWRDTLENFFSKNEELKKWIVYEAGSGLYKFTKKASDGTSYYEQDSPVANKMLVFTDNGIKSGYPISCLDWSSNNTSLVNKIDISYKGSKKDRYIKFGLAAHYESELPMLQEEITRIQSQYMLNEGVFSWVKDKVKAFKDKVVEAIKMFYEKIIKKFITAMIKLAEKSIQLFFQTLGLEPSVTMKTPKW